MSISGIGTVYAAAARADVAICDAILRWHRPMVSRAQTSHAAGGPATVGGVDYEIDCAVADALELVEQLLVDPLCDREIKLQARVGRPQTLTAWDYGAVQQVAVEVKRNATATDAREWFERAAVAAGSSSDGRFRLAYGAVSGAWETTLLRYIALANEADDDERLSELATHDRLPSPEWLRKSVALLRRMELRRWSPSELEHFVATRSRALFASKPEVALPVLRAHLRAAARERRTVRASELLAVLREATVVPRELQEPKALDEADARRVILFLISRCENLIPVALLRAYLGDASGGLDEALSALAASGFVAVGEGPAVVGRRGQPPRMAPPNGSAVLDRLLRLLLAAIRSKTPWATEAHALRLAAALCAMDDLDPRTVATAFIDLDKHLKNLGDVRLVLRTAEACVAAARKPPGTEEARKGEAHALICGLSWAKQRMGRLEEARGDATRSKEIGEYLPWPRNTAFCCKCLGRLLRLEAATKVAVTDREALLQESVTRLREAIEQFARLEEMVESDRNAELGACHSLLGRTFLERGDREATREAIERGGALIPAGRKKDVADLRILTGEFELRWGTHEYARVALSQALEVTDDQGFEVAEMRARAFEQRAKAAASVDAALSDLQEAARVFARLGDADAAARAEFAAMRLQDRVPRELEVALEGESHAVSVRAVRLAEAERKPRGTAVAYRDAIPDRVARDYVAEARRQAVIEDGEASHVVARRPPARPRVRRTKEALATVWKRLVPAARDAVQAARALAAELVGDAPELPVQPETIARRVGVDEVRAADLPRNGELQIDGDRLRILYSASLGRERRRFTIAHEVGHAVLIARGGVLVKDGSDLEKFCDTFAGALLMPECALPKLPAAVSVDDLRDVARRFDVSMPVAAIRLHRARGGFLAFGVEGSQVVWSVGELRLGRVSALPDTVHDAVAAALEGREVPRELLANLVAYGGWWSVSVHRGNTDRLVMVLSPRRPTPSSRERR